MTLIYLCIHNMTFDMASAKPHTHKFTLAVALSTGQWTQSQDVKFFSPQSGLLIFNKVHLQYFPLILF